MVNLGMHKEYAMWKVVIKKYEKKSFRLVKHNPNLPQYRRKGDGRTFVKRWAVSVPLKSGGLHLSIDRQLGAGY